MRVKAIVIITILAALMIGANAHELLRVDINEYPWSSVGKLYNRAGEACTGAVVSRTEILTAAHCLYNPRTGLLLQAASLHFLVGYNQGEYREDLRVAKFVTGPNYKLDGTGASETSDWAILTLQVPVSERIKPLAFADKSAIAGERLEIGGFAQSRLFAMTADTDCHVKAIFSNGLIGHDCAVMKGDSGAPLLRSNGDEMQVVGVHVGSADFDGVAWEIAVPASNFGRR